LISEVEVENGIDTPRVEGIHSFVLFLPLGE